MRSARSLSVLALGPLLSLSACGGGGSSGGMAPEVRIDDSITSDQCVVTLSYLGTVPVDLGDLHLDVTKTDGDFGGEGSEVRCRGLVDGATRQYAVQHCEPDCSSGSQRSIVLQFAMGQMFDDLLLEPPSPLFECLFDGDGASLALLEGNMWLFDKSSEIFSPVTIDVACDGWPGATTTTTTTTLPACDGGCEPGDVVPVQIRVDDEVSLGALQLHLRWGAGLGLFEQFPEEFAVDCRPGPGNNGLYATNQFPHVSDPACAGGCARELVVGMAFGEGFTGPGTVLTCDFVVGDVPASAADIELTIEDATGIRGEPFDVPPSVSLHGLPAD